LRVIAALLCCVACQRCWLAAQQNKADNWRTETQQYATNATIYSGRAVFKRCCCDHGAYSAGRYYCWWSSELRISICNTLLYQNTRETWCEVRWKHFRTLE
jgi:hypothetical protein